MSCFVFDAADMIGPWHDGNFARKDTASVRYQSVDIRPESLEPRTMLAAFGGVGIVYRPDSQNLPSAEIFATEGTVNGSLAAAGSVFQEGTSDRRFERSLWYDSISELPDGRYTRHEDRGYLGNPIEQNGARYLSDRGYPVGWYFADYGTPEEIELLLQRPSFTPDRFDYRGTYRYNLMGVDSENHRGYIADGRLTIGDDLVYTKLVGSQPYTGSFVTGVNADGVLTTSRDEFMYLSASGDTIVFADMGSGDGSLHVGVATKETQPANQQAMIGKYLLAWGVQNGDTLNFSQLLLELESDGDYKFYDLDEYDSGHFDVLERGFWSVSGSTVVLDQDQSTDEIRFTIGEDGKLLIAAQVKTNGNVQSLFALGTKVEAVPGGDKAYFTADATEGGRPKVYQLETDGKWYRTDLLGKGGPVINGPVKSWVDPKDNHTYAAAVTAAATTLYTQDAQKQWSVRNLTTELAGSTSIASELAVMTGPDGKIHITGLNSAGELVRYYQTGGTVAGGGYAWGYENITQRSLIPQGLSTPAFHGLVSFATSWNALNVAGLDSSGDIWAVWWAPGLTSWTVNNLSNEYGADPLAGGLNVWLTSWNAINIGGIASDGSLKVTWWVPQNGSTWIQSNLTEITGGPLLESLSIASFVSSWGAMNIAGVERGTGKIQVYWWSPQSPGQLWQIADMTAALPAGTPSITAPLQGIASSDNSLNVIGISGTHVYRYYWRPDLGTVWAGQDLTSVAVDR